MGGVFDRGFEAGPLGVIAFIAGILACLTLFLGQEYARCAAGLASGGVALLMSLLKIFVGPSRTGGLWLYLLCSIVFFAIHYISFTDLRDQENSNF